MSILIKPDVDLEEIVISQEDYDCGNCAECSYLGFCPNDSPCPSQSDFEKFFREVKRSDSDLTFNERIKKEFSK